MKRKRKERKEGIQTLNIIIRKKKSFKQDGRIMGAIILHFSLLI